MDPTDLPDEVVECILIYLPVEDLLSCCLVNSRWREAVNKNCIWKRHCNENLDLQKPSRVVNKLLPNLSFEDSDLSPICSYRSRFIKETYIKNNFRSGNYKEYECSTNKFPRSESMGKYLLLDDSSKNLFYVYDIENEITLKQTVPYLLQPMLSETFKSVGDKFLIVQCSLLQVYSFVEDSLTLKFCRIFNKEEEFSQLIPANDMISTWYYDNIGLYPCDFSSMNEIVDSYFVGVVQPINLNETKFHIWNLDSGKKLKEESIPIVCESVENICCGKKSKCLYIALYLYPSQGPRCKIFCYDLENLNFTQFYAESSHSIPFMLFEEKVVILPCDQWENSGSYTFVEANTGKLIVEKQFDPPINFKILDVFKSLMVFGSENTVTIVDLNLKEVVRTFFVDFDIREVFLLEHNFLLVSGVMYDCCMVEVWDIKNISCTFKIKDMSILIFERSIQRLCLSRLYSIHILHFW